MNINKEKIMLSQQDSIIFVKHEDILYCQSDNCYTRIYLLNQKRVLIVKSLTKFHKELPEHFVRVNQSYIINKFFVDRIDKKKKLIVLEGECVIPFTITLRDLLTLIKTDVNADEFSDTI